MEVTDSIENRVVKIYRKRAARYNLTSALYYLAGYREFAYHKRAVRALELRPGDTVVEIGCGTGRNFPFLQQAIGPGGKIIGVDLTDAMLAEARRRVNVAGWSNVDLVNCDGADYEFPDGVDGILSTLALSLSPRRAEIIHRGSRALKPGRRWVVMDMKLPPSPASRLLPLAMPILRPFAVTDDAVAERPWEAIWGAMYQNLKNTRIDEWYHGAIYLASGERADNGERVVEP